MRIVSYRNKDETEQVYLIVEVEQGNDAWGPYIGIRAIDMGDDSKGADDLDQWKPIKHKDCAIIIRRIFTLPIRFMQ